ncbi:GLPGLI family protein, partial [uncultured Chryseobacterium sp.]|uniref:GLPGLI family protein n=1 Tax=uncultured Chryseobacterium sp. TaxID=259322 RepID=UPI00261C2D29
KIKLMKLFLFLSIVFFNTFLSAQEKSGKNLSDMEVKYLFTSVRDTMDVDKSHRMKEVMVLTLNSNSSIYYSEGFMKRRLLLESIVNTARNTGASPEIKVENLPKYNISYTVYRNQSQIFITNNLYRDFYTFESDFLQWDTRFNENKNILGYKCQKATVIFGKRLYTAWYTKEIPVSEGPYRFKGLPGLILELSDEKEYDVFQAIGIEKKQVEIKQIQKGIPVTREQYIQKREEFRENPYQGRMIDKAKKEQLIESGKRYNNLMER